MPKHRNEPYAHKTFNMSIDNIEKLKNISEFEGITQGEMVEFLINNYDHGSSPAEKLRKINSQRKEHSERIKELDKETENLQKQMENFEGWKKEKQKKKPEAINILVKRILNRDLIEAERLSKTWAKMTGIPATQLLFEAQDKINSGI